MILVTEAPSFKYAILGKLIQVYNDTDFSSSMENSIGIRLVGISDEVLTEEDTNDIYRIFNSMTDVYTKVSMRIELDMIVFDLKFII